MQEFWIRLASLFIVVSSLWGYNMTIDKREQENKNTQRIASQTENTDSEGAYRMAHTQAVQRALEAMWMSR